MRRIRAKLFTETGAEEAAGRSRAIMLGRKRTDGRMDGRTDSPW